MHLLWSLPSAADCIKTPSKSRICLREEQQILSPDKQLSNEPGCKQTELELNTVDVQAHTVHDFAVGMLMVCGLGPWFMRWLSAACPHNTTVTLFNWVITGGTHHMHNATQHSMQQHLEPDRWMKFIKHVTVYTPSREKNITVDK